MGSDARKSNRRRGSKGVHKRPVSPFLITVLTGPNAGAQVQRDAGTLTIGAGPADDIVIDGLAPGALRLGLSANQARLRPAAQHAVMANYRTNCAAGAVTNMPLPVHLQIDDITAVHLCRIVPERRTWSAALPMVFVGLIAGGLGMVATTKIDLGPPADAYAIAASSPAQNEKLPAEAAVPEVVVATCDDCIAEAAAAMRKFLDDRGLGMLTVSSDAEVVRVTGNYGAGKAADWSAAYLAYDQAWASRVPMIASVGDAVPEAPFAVASVWLGDVPELRTRTGETFRIGDQTKDGWVIDKIAAGQVDIVRATTRLQIVF